MTWSSWTWCATAPSDSRFKKQIFQQLFNKLIGKPMTTIVEQQNKINELLNSGRPVTLETIAQALSVTAQEAAHLLPEGSATFAPGSDFESVWPRSPNGKKSLSL